MPWKATRMINDMQVIQTRLISPGWKMIWCRIILKKIPTDPKEQKLDGSWVDYAYARSVGSVLEYTLISCLENEGDNDKMR